MNWFQIVFDIVVGVTLLPLWIMWFVEYLDDIRIKKAKDTAIRKEIACEDSYIVLEIAKDQNNAKKV